MVESPLDSRPINRDRGQKRGEKTAISKGTGHSSARQAQWYSSGWWYTYPSEKYESQVG